MWKHIILCVIMQYSSSSISRSSVHPFPQFAFVKNRMIEHKSVKKAKTSKKKMSIVIEKTSFTSQKQ